MGKKSLWSLAVMLMLVWMPCYTVFGAISDQQPNSTVGSEQSTQVSDQSTQVNNSRETESNSDATNNSELPLAESAQETSEKVISASDPNHIGIKPLEKIELAPFKKEHAKVLLLLSLQYNEKNDTWIERMEERKYLSGDFIDPLDKSKLTKFRAAGEAKVVLTVYYDKTDETWREAEETLSERQYLPGDFKGLKTDRKTPVLVGIIVLIVVTMISLCVNCFLIYKIHK